MVVKPTADDGVELVVGVAAVLVVLALGGLALRANHDGGVEPHGSRAAVGG
jgi:hypothetical protein